MNDDVSQFQTSFFTTNVHQTAMHMLNPTHEDDTRSGLPRGTCYRILAAPQSQQQRMSSRVHDTVGLNTLNPLRGQAYPARGRTGRSIS
jgi:hypothetical protein